AVEESLWARQTLAASVLGLDRQPASRRLGDFLLVQEASGVCDWRAAGTDAVPLADIALADVRPGNSAGVVCQRARRPPRRANTQHATLHPLFLSGVRRRLVPAVLVCGAAGMAALVWHELDRRI